MRAPLFLISLALSSAACSDRAEYAETAEGVDPQSSGAQTPPLQYSLGFES